MERTPADLGSLAAMRDNQNEKEDKKDKPTVKLIDTNGNAFAIMGRVRRALKNAGLEDQVERYTKEAMAGDYDNLLMVTQEYVDVE